MKDHFALTRTCPVCGAKPNQHCIRDSFPEREDDKKMYQSEYHYGR